MSQSNPHRGPTPWIPGAAWVLLDGCLEPCRARLAGIGRASIEMDGDIIAEAAIGSTHDADSRASFERHASAVIDRLRRQCEIDASAFQAVDGERATFVGAERKTLPATVRPDVADALEAERSASDRNEVRALVRDGLACVLRPFAVRGLVETTWADCPAAERRDNGTGSTARTADLRALDDRWWSAVVRERAAQKTRLGRMVRTPVSGLRKRCAAPDTPAAQRPTGATAPAPALKVT